MQTIKDDTHLNNNFKMMTDNPLDIHEIKCYAIGRETGWELKNKAEILTLFAPTKFT